jgi:hypothetical protein
MYVHLYICRGGGGSYLIVTSDISLTMNISCPPGSRCSIPGRAQIALFPATYLLLRLAFLSTKISHILNSGKAKTKPKSGLILPFLKHAW